MLRFRIILLLSLGSLLAHAQMPQVITFQGALTDTLGKPRSDGIYNVFFALYESPDGGGQAWSQTLQLQVTRGLFQAHLALYGVMRLGKTYYLGVTVGQEHEMTPRIMLTAVPYAFLASTADTARFAFHALRADTATFARFQSSATYADTSGVAKALALPQVLDGTQFPINMSTPLTIKGFTSGAVVTAEHYTALAVHSGDYGPAITADCGGDSPGYGITASGFFGLYGMGQTEGVPGMGVVGQGGPSGGTGVWGRSSGRSGIGVVGSGGGANGAGVIGLCDTTVEAWASVTGIGVLGRVQKLRAIGVMGVAPIGGTALYSNGAFYQSGGRFEAHPTTTLWTTNKATTVKRLDGSSVKLFPEEAAELWFTDYGQGQLSNGHAHIELDPAYLQTVTIDQAHPFRAFVQTEGDCKGVYVTNKTATGFDVVECSGGNSAVAFSYRVACKRKFYEDERLASEEQDIQFNGQVLQNQWPQVQAAQDGIALSWEEQQRLFREQTKVEKVVSARSSTNDFIPGSKAKSAKP